MSLIGLRLPAIALFLSFVIILVIAPICADASGVYDGTYDYSYSFNGPNGRETYNVPSGFIISNGMIYSNPSAYTGSIDATGNARFTGPCPQGGSATFSGVVRADGTGGGSYQGPSGVTGTWSVTLVGGSGGDSWVDDFTEAIFTFFDGVGTAIGVSEDMAAVTGFMVTVVPILVLVIVIGSAGAKRREQQNAKGGSNAGHKRGKTEKRTRGYAASPAGEPVETGAIAPPITISANAHRTEAVGEVRSDSSQPARLNLRAAWTRNQVTLNWSRPDMDPAVHRLDGYEVSVLKFGPGSTAPVKTLVARLPQDVIQWMSHYDQTYQFSTDGDINGYVVDALLSHATSTGQNEVLRIGATAFAPAH